jgi:hypothetical protein
MKFSTKRLAAVVLAFGMLSSSCGSSGTSAGASDGGALDATSANGAGGADGSGGGGAVLDGSLGSGAHTDGGASDAGNPCPTYQQLCNGACIPTVTDPQNCGGCGATCTGNQVCSGGACAATCLPGLTACAGTCADTLTDNANCGTCGTTCPAGQGCANGTCVVAVVLGDAGAGCAGGGPPGSISVDAGQECAGLLATTTFTWALCSCTDITFSASVLTDGFDSTKGPYAPGGLGGGVGLNGKFAASVPKIDIGGTLWEASDGGMSQEAETEVHQELHVGGPLYGAALTVRGDAHVTGNVSGAPGNPSDPGPPYLAIDGGLFVSPGATVTGKVTYTGALQPELNPVTPPCDCAHPVPVAAIAQAGQAHNDNASIGLDPGLLSSFGTPARLDLPCGTFYFDAMKLTGPLTIVAHGHTVILVGGDLFTSSPLEITVDPTGTLDVFIAGTISDSSLLAFGNPGYPALERIYVGTPLGIPFTGNVMLAANLYAAASNLVSWSSTNDIYGSVIAGNFISSQPTRIHFDQGVLASGGSCADAGAPTCGSCTDCGNQACIAGQCGACTDSAQCCAPLECFNGVCMVSGPPK